MGLTLDEIMRNGLWPNVISICTFKNSDSIKTTSSELTLLNEHCKEYDCPNIAGFTEILHFDEISFDTAVSYVFCLVPHYVNIEEDLSEFEVNAALLQHDLLIGSRCGHVKATDWLLDFFASANRVTNQEIHYIDRLFGNTITASCAPRRCLSKEDMVDVALGYREIKDFPLETDQ